jgi:hypothetical protein
MDSSSAETIEINVIPKISFTHDLDPDNPRIVFLKQINNRPYWYYKHINKI